MLESCGYRHIPVGDLSRHTLYRLSDACFALSLRSFCLCLWLFLLLLLAFFFFFPHSFLL